MLGKSNVIDGRGVHGKAYRSFNKVLLASVYTESLLSHDLSHSTGSYVATAALVARNPREAPRQAEYEIEEDEERVVLGTVKVMESTLDGEWNKAICKPNSQHNAFAFAKQKQLANGEKRVRSLLSLYIASKGYAQIALRVIHRVILNIYEEIQRSIPLPWPYGTESSG